jgi:hypothetical protein
VIEYLLSCHTHTHTHTERERERERERDRQTDRQRALIALIHQVSNGGEIQQVLTGSKAFIFLPTPLSLPEWEKSSTDFFPSLNHQNISIITVKVCQLGSSLQFPALPHAGQFRIFQRGALFFNAPHLYPWEIYIANGCDSLSFMIIFWRDLFKVLLHSLRLALLEVMQDMI